MRRVTKIYLTVVVALLLTQLFSLCFFVAVPVARAADDPRELKLAVPFNNFKDLGSITEGPCLTKEEAAKRNIAEKDIPQCVIVPWLVNYIGNAYRYGVVIGSILAVVMIMIGGLLYMTAGINPQMASRGKEYIVGAVTGLALLLGSYMLLNIVNPNLVHLQPVKVEILKKAVMAPEFCEDLLSSLEFKDAVNIAYPAEGDTCGQKFVVTMKPGAKISTSVSECIGKRCREKTACDKENGVYRCIGAFVYGHITIAEDIMGSLMRAGGVEAKSAYLDYVKLYEYAIGEYDSEVGKSILDNKSTEYKIARDDRRFDKQNYYLQLEVNDKTWAFGTLDDTYYLDRLGNPIGIVDNLEKCCTYSCSGDGKFTVEQGCQFFHPFQLNNEAIRVDIDTNKFYCGDKPLRESTNDAGQGDFDKDGCLGFVSETLPPLSQCRLPSQCKGGSCITRTWFDKDVTGEQACSCTSDNDCPINQKCIQVEDGCGWNYCIDENAKVPSVPQGSSGSATQPWAGLCGKDSDCDQANGARCQTDWGANNCNACKGGLKVVGAVCATNNECTTNDCEDEGGVKKCECNDDSQCPRGWQCVEMEGDCGHNFCSEWPVDEGEKCANSDDCDSGNCVSSLGACNVCGEPILD